MKMIMRAVACLSFVIGTNVAPEAAAQTYIPPSGSYTWYTGSAGLPYYKDTGMAQFPVQVGIRSIAGALDTLFLGSENFATGPGKVNVFFGPYTSLGTYYTTPANDSSIHSLYGGFSSKLGFAFTADPKSVIAVGTDSAHVYLFDGTTFTNVTPTAAAFSSNLGVYSIAEYSQKLFIGTGGSAGSAQVWATADGVQWTQQSLPGFSSSNYYAWVMTVFNNELYLGTVDYSEAAQVWKYDGNSWSMMNIPGFSSNNYAIGSMTVYNSKLYIGTSDTLGSGAEIWSYDGSAWTKLPGFGKNDAATAMISYNNALLIGTTNYAQGASGQLWSYDGTTLSQVTAPSSFTSAGNSGIVSLAVANGSLYVGTYNNSGAELWPVTASTSGSSASLPGALTGLWWNPNESGWGIHFTQRGSTIFAAWYTYDTSGNPKWYVASDCVGMTGTSGTCTGSLYQVNGPMFFGVNFTPATSSEISVAGSFSVTFTDANNASMSYTVGPISRTVSIMREPVTVGTTIPAVDYTDLWWNPSESGWGMAMTQGNANIFIAWFVYDGSGKPVWYVASNCAVSGNGCSGTLYSTTGPPLGSKFDPSQVHINSVGNIGVNFTDPNNAVLTYTVNGVSGTKNVTRQLF